VAARGERAPASRGGPPDTGMRRGRPVWLEVGQTLLLAVVLAFLIRTFVVESFQVSGFSMMPTLHNGDRVLVDKLLYAIEGPRTGEIIVFKSPVKPKQDWIKRVIGTPGDTVKIVAGNVYINGRLYQEPFIKFNYPYNYGPVKVTAGHLFVLGDNRPNSYDSRYFGLLNESAVRGDAFFIWWPLKYIGGL
jgi:signal peptidase I